MHINVPKNLDHTIFDRLSRKFSASESVSLFLPDDLSAEEICGMADFLLHQIPNELSYLLLADLAELDKFPADLLEEVLCKGDQGCRVAVALRDDLSERLQELCRTSSDEEVRSHYAVRKAHRGKTGTDHD